MICQALALGLGYDTLDGSNCACLELMARRALMIERAVKVNPKAPNFQGLQKMIEHSLDEGGGIATREFTKYMAEQAEAEGKVLKQQRLLREELASNHKKDKDGKGDGKGSPGGGSGSGS